MFITQPNNKHEKAFSQTQRHIQAAELNPNS